MTQTETCVQVLLLRREYCLNRRKEILHLDDVAYLETYVQYVNWLRSEYCVKRMTYQEDICEKKEHKIQTTTSEFDSKSKRRSFRIEWTFDTDPSIDYIWRVSVSKQNVKNEKDYYQDRKYILKKSLP